MVWSAKQENIKTPKRLLFHLSTFKKSLQVAFCCYAEKKILNLIFSSHKTTQAEILTCKTTQPHIKCSVEILTRKTTQPHDKILIGIWSQQLIYMGISSIHVDISGKNIII